jgi:DNA-binding CsgD family transcriptional regulator
VLVPRSSVGREVYSFVDNQVREVLYQDIGTARRRRYHLRAGEAMEKVHNRRPVEQYGVLAHHFLEGNDLEKAADYSIRAGDLAHGQAAFPRAQSHYQIAEELLEELEEESERTAHVHAQLGMNLVTRYAVAFRSEGSQRGIEYINRAINLFVKLGNPRRSAVLHRTLGAAYNVGGGVGQDTQQALHHYQAAVDLMEAEEDSLEKAIAYDGLGVWNLFGGFELDRAEELSRKALRIAEAIGNPDAMSQACTTLDLALLVKGDLDDGRSFQESAWEYAQQSRMPVTKERAAAYPIHNSPWLADPDQYRKWFDRWEEVARGVKTRRYDPAVLGTMSAVSALVGNPEASREFLAKLDDIGPVPIIALHGVAQAILGDWEAARRIMVSYNWTGGGASRMRALGVAPHYGRLLLDMGEPENAEELLRDQWDYCRDGGAITFELNLLPPLCECYARLGRLTDARQYLDRAQEILSKPEDWNGLAAGATLAEGLLAAAEERWEDAEPFFRRAVEINKRYGLVYDQARALYQWANMTLARPAASERQRGLELLDQSLTLFQRCDAKKDIEGVTALQEQAASQPAKPPAYPDGLTQREVEVLRLVAAGKSNPEIGAELFISPRTVTTHVSNILNKINAANRAEATGYAVREGLA